MKNLENILKLYIETHVLKYEIDGKMNYFKSKKGYMVSYTDNRTGQSKNTVIPFSKIIKFNRFLR